MACPPATFRPGDMPADVVSPKNAGIATCVGTSGDKSAGMSRDSRFRPPLHALAKKSMLNCRLRASVCCLARVGSQLGDARDRRVVVQAAVDKATADHGAGTALAAAAVDVNDSA